MVKLKAATLLESMVAMVIITISLGVTTMVYVNVLESDGQMEEMRAKFLVEAELRTIKAEKKFLDTEKQVGDYSVTEVIKAHDLSDHLYQLSLAVKNKEGKLLILHNELIIIEE